MDEKLRREMGAHYTSEENILKVLKPLFLDDLWVEFEKVKYIKKELEQFHNKIASLKFLDPACGCGNFLIIAYRELRKLEYAILNMLLDDNLITPFFLVKSFLINYLYIPNTTNTFLYRYSEISIIVHLFNKKKIKT